MERVHQNINFKELHIDFKRDINRVFGNCIPYIYLFSLDFVNASGFSLLYFVRWEPNKVQFCHGQANRDWRGKAIRSPNELLRAKQDLSKKLFLQVC